MLPFEIVSRKHVYNYMQEKVQRIYKLQKVCIRKESYK